MTTSTWSSREARILAAVAANEGDFGVERDRKLAELTGIDTVEVRRATQQLFESGYITGAEASDREGFELLDIRLTERGRREVGQWPRDDAAAVAFVTALEKTIDHAPPADRGKLVALRDAAKQLGYGVLGNLITKAVFGV